jgi:hypothetical protein
MWLAAALGTAGHRGTLLRLVLGPPDPAASAAPDVVGVDGVNGARITRIW